MAIWHHRPSNAKFCPFCGVGNLQRDLYKQELKVGLEGKNAVEFVCNVCNAGFGIVISYRVALADRMHKEMRGLRVNAFDETKRTDQGYVKDKEKREKQALCKRKFQTLANEENHKAKQRAKVRYREWYDTTYPKV